MSTRSAILFQDSENKTEKLIQFHWDGYPRFMGSCLASYLSNVDTVREYFSHKQDYLSSFVLPNNLVNYLEAQEIDYSEAYNNKRNKLSTDLSCEAISKKYNCDMEYLYVFKKCKDDEYKWLVSDLESDVMFYLEDRIKKDMNDIIDYEMSKGKSYIEARDGLFQLAFNIEYAKKAYEKNLVNLYLKSADFNDIQDRFIEKNDSFVNANIFLKRCNTQFDNFYVSDGFFKALCEQADSIPFAKIDDLDFETSSKIFNEIKEEFLNSVPIYAPHLVNAKDPFDYEKVLDDSHIHRLENGMNKIREIVESKLNEIENTQELSSKPKKQR